MKNKEIYIISGILVVIGIVIVWVLISMNGNVTTTGENPEVERTDAVMCTTDNVRYPFLEQKLDEIGYGIKVDMTFDEGKLDIISLKYDTEYTNEERASEAYQILTPEFNIALSDGGEDLSNELNTRFTLQKEHVLLTVLAKGENLTAKNRKYLMIADGDSESEITEKNKLVENYVNLGFECN